LQDLWQGTEIKPTEPDTDNAVVGNSEDMTPEGHFPSCILSEVFPACKIRFVLRELKGKPDHFHKVFFVPLRLRVKN
jgi:hypothetical protein